MEPETIHLLLIEDNPVDACIVQSYLGDVSEFPLDVAHAASLTAGLAALKKKRFDVVLLDLGLPESFGLDTLLRVRAHHPDVPVVILTALEARDAAVQAVQAGAEDYLAKSWLEPNLLVRTIRHAIERAGRRSANDKLAQSELRFRTLFEQSPYGVVLIEPQTLLPVDFNNAACQQLGYSREEFAQLRISDYEAAETPEETARHVEAVLRAGPSSFETRHRTKSGQLRDISVTVQAISLGGRQLLHAIYRDVTERRREHEALRQSEAELRSLFENLPDLVLVVSRDGLIQFANRDAATLPEQRLIGSDWLGRVVPEHQARCREALDRTIGERNPQTLEVIDSAGHWWQCRLAPLPQPDGPSQALVICTDVSEQRKVELALGEREQRYRQLLAAVTNYTYSVELQDGVPASTNHSWGCLSVTGYTPDDYQSDPYLWFNMIYPHDRDTVLKYVERILAGESVPPIEHRIVRRDGSIRWLRNTIVPHLNANQLVRYDGLVEDITDRWQAERSLRQKEAQLLAAGKLQERLLPAEAPKVPGFDIAGAVYPAEFIAGDFFDYLPMPDGKLGIVISDVSGHGFGPSLLMASTSTLIRSLTETQTDLNAIMAKVNHFLVQETDDDQFVTLLLGCLDPWTRRLIYSSAGHPPGYVFDRSGNVKARLESTAVPLAILPDAQFPIAETIALERGDVVLLMTDGVQDALSPEGSFFGRNHILQSLRANLARPACEIIKRLYRDVCDFAQRDNPADDVTVVVLKVEGS